MNDDQPTTLSQLRSSEPLRAISAETWARIVACLEDHATPETQWQALSQQLLGPEMPFDVHRALYHFVYRSRPESAGPGPAWLPEAQEAASTNWAALAREVGVRPEELWSWSVSHRERFWEQVIKDLGIAFAQRPRRTLSESSTTEHPEWLPGARYNIGQSCFLADSSRVAITFRQEGDERIQQWTYGQLDRQCELAARAIAHAGIQPGEAVGMMMPMTPDSVAIYLALVRMGCAVVSIADSFAPPEIQTRLDIANASAMIIQAELKRGSKCIRLYERACSFDAPMMLVLGGRQVALRQGDHAWETLVEMAANSQHEAPPLKIHLAGPDENTNILFSSGTTGQPKAIPWTHLTPIKCAMDGKYHHDIREGDVVAWPTNLGWMMGPWLIYASLMNRATMALFDGAPTGRGFCQFVADARVTMLGVVPSLVRLWRETGAIEGLDWRCIRAFSSTGECSNPDEMLYLMSRAGYRPIIEYCGGTEIGGGYITSSLVHPNAPSTFSTPALGLDLRIVNLEGESADQGEVYLVPPSIGLSTKLLNRDHHAVYYEGSPQLPGTPQLRRHGDEMQRFDNGFYRAQGRSDDTMNLGGIKVSSAEIERCLNRHPAVRETAAIAVPPPGGGPSQLIVVVVPDNPAALDSLDDEQLLREMRALLKRELNPLFKIERLLLRPELPRTASNKVMRRVLRDQSGQPAS